MSTGKHCKIIETRNGSSAMVQQFIHGTQYIDELVLVRVKDKGDFYVHQDANWNVIALTDLGGKLVESLTRCSPRSGGPPKADASYARCIVSRMYTPYGQVSVFQESGFVLDTAWSAEPTAAAQPAAARRMTSQGEGDQDVDAADKGTPGTTCSGGAFVGACRVLDLDFDGDYDSADGTLFDSLESDVMVRPGGMHWIAMGAQLRRPTSPQPRWGRVRLIITYPG